MSHVIALYSSDVFATFNFRGSFISKLITKGHRVVCFLPNIDHEVQDLILNLGAEIVHVNIKRASLNVFHIPMELVSLLRAIHRIKPDILLSFFIKPNLISGLVVKIYRNVRFVCIVEGAGSMFSQKFSSTIFWRFFQKIMFCVYRVSLNGCQRVIFLNEEDVNQFLSLNLISREQVAFLGSIGVDLEKYKFQKRDVRNPVFLMCARIIREKGVVEFIEASKIIVSTYSNAQFLLLGGLDDHPNALNKSEFLDLLEGAPVIWCGHTDVLPFLKKSTCFVLPTSYREGSPRSIQEALAASLPVITTDIAGCRELVIAGETGLLIEPQSISSLVDAMELIINNPQKAMIMGQNGRRFAEKFLDCDVANNILYDVVFEGHIA